MSQPITVNCDRRRLLFWEAKCISVELTAIALGLVFALRLDNWAVGTPFLFAVCAASIVVRLQHYLRVS